MLDIWEFSEGRLPNSRKACHPETTKPYQAWERGRPVRNRGRPLEWPTAKDTASPLEKGGTNVESETPALPGEILPRLGYQINFNPILISRPVPSTSV
jgi:hypothetical protein